MFAYIEVIQNNSSVSYGYSNFSFSGNLLSIKPLKGMKQSGQIDIFVDQITKVSEDTYYSWNRIKFDYRDSHFVFLYSGFGEFDYLKEHLITEIMA
ncbi:hypothetical protein [Companilactobacillus nuruki]|uniref:GRAM domain-containing protein n=1 Tax=Companilactobacillus nuruki TaxID=1993540 RepID=A0A2N7AXP2_9LACO|nr:hypothetical protein [Companilactobacillus nuruki]PMD73836.1 hypothetical protein CBP76_00385 [Companilactobacillus nuruki]